MGGKTGGKGVGCISREKKRKKFYKKRIVFLSDSSYNRHKDKNFTISETERNLLEKIKCKKRIRLRSQYFKKSGGIQNEGDK